MKTLLSFALRLLISVFFLGLLWWMVRDDLPQIIGIIRRADHGLIALSALLFLSTAVILSRRLQLIFGAQNVTVKLREAVSLTFVGYFFNNFLPTSVGGDVVKAMCAARVTGEAMKSVTAVMMDRILGLFTFVLIPSVSLLFYLQEIKDRKVPILVYSLLAFAVLFFFMIFSRGVARRFKFIEPLMNRVGVGTKIRRVYEQLHAFRQHKGIVAQALLLSMAAQVIAILVLYLFSRAMASSAQPIYFFLLVPVIHLMSMVPSINGLGIREWAYIQFLTPVVGKQVAGALGFLWFGLLILLSVIGGLVYLARSDYHIRWKDTGVSDQEKA